MLREQDRLLLGTDLVKDPAVLEAAYNDAAGVTAAFNRNLLAVINRELDADFDLDAFEHVAFYDREQEWIEMRLRARAAAGRAPRALDLDVHFANREELRTEVSAKFTRERLEADLARPACELESFLTDADEPFALVAHRRCANSRIMASESSPSPSSATRMLGPRTSSSSGPTQTAPDRRVAERRADADALLAARG